MMEQEKIIDELANLPPAARRQVFDYIAFLQARYSRASKPKRKAAIDWSKEAFVGIWKNRKDMNDSVSWVRQIRQSQWKD